MKLERAWEAIQDIYTTYANINAYKYGMREFCNFVEDTYIITLKDGKHIKAFYNPEETDKVQKAGLADFLNHTWRNEFKKRAKPALEKAQELTSLYHNNMPAPFDAIREVFVVCNKNLNDLFVVFGASQPQYTALVERHIKTLLSDKMERGKVDEVFNILTLPERPTPMLEEDMEREKLFGKIGDLDETKKEQAFETHTRQYGLTYAADGAKPLSIGDLEKEYVKHDKSSVSSADKWQSELEQLKNQKKNIKEKYGLSQEIIDLTNDIAELGALRIDLRVKGWMPISHILSNEIIPELAKKLQFSIEELLACRDFEILDILKGKPSVEKAELQKRNVFIAYGIHDKENFLLSGPDGESELESGFEFPQVQELKGQSAMRGVVEGECFVIKWDGSDISELSSRMPESSILVAGQTRPQLMPLIKKASAIVTDEGGLLSHAAIVSRELKIPAVIGTKQATDILETGMKVKVDADNGVVIPI